jgi:hypothetical protein
MHPHQFLKGDGDGLRPVSFMVEPEEAWRTVVLNRWRKPCPSCFDTEAEKTSVRYKFTDVEPMSWSDQPSPRNRAKRKR